MKSGVSMSMDTWATRGEGLIGAVAHRQGFIPVIIPARRRSVQVSSRSWLGSPHAAARSSRMTRQVVLIYFELRRLSAIILRPMRLSRDQVG